MNLNDLSQEELAQLLKSISSLNGSFTTLSKSAEMRKLQEAAYLKNLEKLSGLHGSEVKNLADKIKREEEEGRHAENRNKKIVEGFNKVVSGLNQFASSALSNAQSVYNSDKVFSGVAGNIDTFAGAIKSVTSAFASLADGIPIAEGLAHFADKTAGAIVDLGAQSLKIQLENAEKLITTYQSLSKVGVTYAGDIARIQRDAAAVGLGMTTYAKFIKDSIQDFSNMGGTTTQTAQRIAKLGKDIATTDGRLLTMYGTYEDLMSATADYQSLMAGFGIDITKTSKDLKTATMEYLYAQKELTQLTGVSADTYKKEAQERQTHLAYQMALQNLGGEDPEIANTIDRAITEAGKFFGKDIQAVMEEAVANQTFDVNRSVDPINAALASQLPSTVKDLLNQYIQGARANDRERMAAAASQMPDKVQEMARQNDWLRRISQMPSILKDMPAVVQSLAKFQSTTISQSKTLRDQSSTLKTLKEDRDKPQTQESKEYNTLLNKQQEILQAWDKKTVDSFNHVAELAQSLYDFQMKIVDNFPDFAGAVDRFGEYVDKLLGRSSSKSTVKPPKSGSQLDKEVENLPSSKTRPDGTKFNPYVPNQPGSGLPGGGVTAPSSFQAPEPGKGPVSKGISITDLMKIIDFGPRSGDLDHFQQLDSKVQDNFVAMAQEYYSLTKRKLSINSAARSFTEQKDLYDAWIKRGKTGLPAAPPGGSSHERGMALDINPSQIADLQAKQLLAKYRFKPLAGDEVHLDAFKDGGITNGPSLAGEDPNKPHEAVVPLPDGRTIPVKMDVSVLVDKFDEMIDVLKEHKDTSEKIYKATV